jgi:hypothetical protein
MAWQKSFNSYGKRAHLRLWCQSRTIQGEQAWLGAYTALLNHVDRTQMEADGKVYVAKGTWNLLGQRPTDGAGGPVQTERHIPFTLRVVA